MTSTPLAYVPLADQEAMLAHYSAALDEVYSLRRLVAYEAMTTLVDLEYKTFPKSRRRFAQARVDRLRAAARGETGNVVLDLPHASLRHALKEAGAAPLLTRHAWETNRGRP